MSHHVGVNSVHQIGTDSNSVPVLCLMPLSKSHRIPQGKPPSAGYPWTLMWGGVSGTHQDEASRVHQAQGDQDLDVRREGTDQNAILCEGKNGFLPRATQLSLSLILPKPP